MIRSMTGYARAESQGSWGRLSWELRSVNHRYLDLTLRLPDDLRNIENEVRQRAGAKLSRGKVEVALRISRESAEMPPLALDPERIAQLRRALDDLAHELGPAAVPDPMRVLAWPGIVKAETADLGPVQIAALNLFDEALVDFAETRRREGEKLTQHVLERCDQIESLVAKVRDRLPRVRAQWLEKLRARCQELGVDVEPGRLEQEAVLAAQRLDVDEEMSRLAAHVIEVRQTLGRQDAVGRRLDFLMQELNREANTLSSKSQDADITKWAVDVKVLIEQMREQIQNIE